MPDEPLAVPVPVHDRHAGWTITLAWGQIPDCATWRMTRASEERFVKVARIGHVPGLRDERDRMMWAASHLPVPHVIDSGSADGVEWLLTAALPGMDATRMEASADPSPLVTALARGLRAFHAAPADACPFHFELAVAVPHARARVAAGLVDAERHMHPEHQHLSPKQASAQLERVRPADEDLVVCHGDYCLPNVMLERGRVTGYVDLGELGVADRWWDLAIATWSVTWNLGPGWEDAFLREYGIARDPDRIAYYRLLYDLAS